MLESLSRGSSYGGHVALCMGAAGTFLILGGSAAKIPTDKSPMQRPSVLQGLNDWEDTTRMLIHGA